MSNTTKLALEASLKKLLLKKPVDKITINDLTEDCGISRMAFYYHFKDIYDLIEWACLEDGKRALADKKTYSTWSEGLEQIFEAVLENKPFILNVLRKNDFFILIISFLVKKCWCQEWHNLKGMLRIYYLYQACSDSLGDDNSCQV